MILKVLLQVLNSFYFNNIFYISYVFINININLLTLIFIAFYYSTKVHSNIAFKITLFFRVICRFRMSIRMLPFLYSLNNYSFNVRDMSA